MRTIAELTELEAVFVNSLITAYPGGLAYKAERDPEVREFAAALIAEGRVQRGKLDEPGAQGGFYRLTDRFASNVRNTAKKRADGAYLN